ncbi:TlpA family protein disulfide reductase [Pedobacter sp.]
MKKLFSLLLLIFSISFTQAQVTSKTIKLDEKTIVKDESGNIYPFNLWRKFMETGQYSLKLISDKDALTPEFQLFQMTPDQIEESKKQRSEYASTLPKPSSSRSFRDGQKFRFENMKYLNGNKFDSKTDTGKVVVLNFWFINCPPCKKEIPELNELVEKYKDKNVIFIAIALDDAYSLNKFLRMSPFNYNIVEDGTYYSQKYVVKSYPTHVVVGKDGKVKFSTSGLGPNTIYWVDKTISAEL